MKRRVCSGSARFRARSACGMTVRFAVLLLLCSGFWAGQSYGQAENPDPTPAVAGADSGLLAALSIAAARSSAKTRETFASFYQGRPSHKAVAADVASGRLWQASRRASEEEAEQEALEGCEVFSEAPCTLVAIDEKIQDNFPAREMPRVHYAGAFDPAQIPLLQRGVREREDVVAYASAPLPKAAAYHPTGKLFIVTGAPSLEAAELEALSTCNKDPARNGQNGPCYLYASDNEVVLPRHSKISDESLRHSLNLQLAAIASGGKSPIDDEVSRYLGVRSGHKAIAAADTAPFTIVNVAGLPTAPEARIMALERCQILQRAPCMLVAVDDATVPAPGDGKVRSSNMARVNYNGIFDPNLIPGLLRADRDRPDVAGYLRTPGPKAAAINAGKITIVSGAASQFEAEQQALAACGTACYLYAAIDKVVLTQYRKEPRPRGKTLGDVLSYALVDDAGSKLAKNFEEGKPHKSVAMLPESGRTFSYRGSPSAEMAQQQALEACQLMFNAPCVTIAVDGKILAPDPFGALRRSMPRVTYQGSYRADMVPLFHAPTKEMQGYASLGKPKAMAIRAPGAKLTVGTGRTLVEAEAKALAQCNDDSPYPCILYAANERIILPQRRTEPEP